MILASPNSVSIFFTAAPVPNRSPIDPTKISNGFVKIIYINTPKLAANPHTQPTTFQTKIPAERFYFVINALPALLFSKRDNLFQNNRLLHLAEITSRYSIQINTRTYIFSIPRNRISTGTLLFINKCGHQLPHNVVNF